MCLSSGPISPVLSVPSPFDSVGEGIVGVFGSPVGTFVLFRPFFRSDIVTTISHELLSNLDETCRE